MGGGAERDQPDPWDGSYDLGEPQTFNRYAYVRNDPVNYVDPSGMFALNTAYYEAMRALWELWWRSLQMSGALVQPVMAEEAPFVPLVATQTQNPVDASKLGEPPLSRTCLSALAVARTDLRAVERANRHVNTLKLVAEEYGINPSVLAAIGIRETGFRAIYEYGRRPGTGGVGVFQIDMRYHGGKISAQEAMNIPTAARYAAGLLASSFDFYSSQGFSEELSEAAAIRDYNASPGRGHRRTLAYLRQAEKTGDVGALNGGTTGRNYVSNVLDIARHCFGL